MKKFQLIAIFFLIVFNLFGRPRFVDMADELKSSRFIGIVEIQEYYTDPYDSSNNNIRIIQKVKLKTIIGDSIIFATVYRSEQLEPYYELIYPGREEFTGFWPNEDDIVLVIIDSLNNISLFGIKIDDSYRIWSPYTTGSTASFIIKEPVKPLALDDRTCISFPTGIHCADGCLLPIDAIDFSDSPKQ